MDKSQNYGKKGKFGHLLFRNQFVLGPAVAFPEKWKEMEIGGRLRLHIHPGLNFNRVEKDGKSVMLLGYILDPDNPDAGDSDILQDLLHRSGNCMDLLKNTAEYGGRWVIIADDGKDSILFNDAAGLRQVFYAKVDSGLWCASQPGILSSILELKMDPPAVGFINSEEFTRDEENRWPGESSAYKEIKHLLPNHCLDLKTGRRKRYWPDHRLGAVSLEEGAQIAADTLRGLMKSAAQRFELALSMTAGLDSRLVLAASREIKDRLDFVTINQVNMGMSHPDVQVPSRLLTNLKLPHTIIGSSQKTNDDFLDTFLGSVDFAHRIYASDAYAIHRHGGQNKVAVTGSVSEIARCSYRITGKVTAEVLARLQRMGNNRFAVDHFNKWLADLGDSYNIHPLDMFEWEQGHGNWLAMCQLEFDTAWKDIFTPFNCRALLTGMLSVPEEYRKPPEYSLYKKTIMLLWPELLDTPINPPYKKNSHFYTRAYFNGRIRKLGNIFNL